MFTKSFCVNDLLERLNDKLITYSQFSIAISELTLLWEMSGLSGHLLLSSHLCSHLATELVETGLTRDSHLLRDWLSMELSLFEDKPNGGRPQKYVGKTKYL